MIPRPLRRYEGGMISTAAIASFQSTRLPVDRQAFGRRDELEVRKPRARDSVNLPALDRCDWRVDLTSYRSGAAERFDEVDGKSSHAPRHTNIAYRPQAEKYDDRICDNRTPTIEGGMDLDEIKRRMAARGMKQADLGEAIGLEQNKVSLSLNGKRRLTVAEMDKIRVLLADDPSGPPARAIPYVGDVAGGNWREAIQRSGMSVPAPDPSIPPNAFALRVSGDSMDLLVDDGGTVIVDPDDKKLYPKKYYVIINGDGETTFKQFLADPARLAPCSSNPEHTEIELGAGEPFRVVGRVIWRAARM